VTRGATLILAAYATLAPLGAAARAQNAQEAQEPPDRRGAVREEALVERVVVDAHVLGSDGMPIVGLTPSDFFVKVDGKPAVIEAVDWIAADTPEADASALEGVSGEEAARFRSDAPPGRLILMFFQTDYNTSRLNGLLRMAQQARAFLSTLVPTDRVAVASYDSQLKLRQDFTADRGRIERAIQAAIRMGPAGKPDPDSHPSIARYLDPEKARRAGTPERALELLGRSLIPVPGGKSMIFFGWGLGTVGGLGGPVAAERYAWSDALHAMGQARMNIFTLDVTDADYHSLEGYLQQISDLTGGKYEKTNLFPSLAMEHVRKAISGRYVVTFLKPKNLPRGDHDIELSVVARRAAVFARQYFQD
jgi:VWFA-related protein